MDRGGVKFFIVVGAILLTCCEKTVAQSSGLTASIFELTERSFYVQWSKFAGSFSYKVTANPVNPAAAGSVFAAFSSKHTMGTLNMLMPDTLYDVTVEAVTSTGVILAQALLQHRTAPEIPVINQSYSRHSNSITVEWNAVPGASNYLVTARYGELFYETIVPNSPGTVSGLDPAVKYKITVRSINLAGKSQPSRPKWTQTVLAAANATTSSPTSNSVLVDWDPVNASVLYSVSIARSDGVGSVIIKNVTDTNLLFTGLDPGTVYTIMICAWDATSTPGDETIPTQITRSQAPNNINISLDVANLDATFTWPAAVGTTEYTVLLYSSDGGPVLNCTSSSTSCSITSLACGKLYSVSLTASNDAGSTQSSTAKSLLTVPCTPGGITVSEDTPGNMFVSWSDVQLADYYIAIVKNDEGMEMSCNASLSTCYFPTECGYVYFVNVFAYNNAGQSALGAVLNYTTAPCCPGDVSPAFVSGDTLEIMWSPVRGADIYETRAVDGTNVIHCNDTSTVCALSTLQCDTTYSVSVYAYSGVLGSNTSCPSRNTKTAPCSPDILNITNIDASTYAVHWESGSVGATYLVTARGHNGLWNCTSGVSFCTLTNLPCGNMFVVHVVASTPAGPSLPSYAVPLETAPCCPTGLNAVQVTQSMTNVSWSTALGAMTYSTMLESSKGQAICHTQQNHCLLGCITCSSNYSVSLEAISETGLTSVCTFQGYSSSACCPLGIKVARLSSTAIRVSWGASSGQVPYSAELFGAVSYLNCTQGPGASYCDITDVACGDVYTVVVSPIAADGSKLTFCPKKIYSVTCSGSSVGMVLYRGKRSAE